MMENKKVSEKKDSWLKVLLSYTEGSGQRLGISVILSVISIISGLMPYYCIYRGIDLYIRNLNQAPMQEILRWCLYALLFYTIKIVSFSASTWISHIAAYHILEGLRLRLTDRFLKAPLGDVEGHSIGEIKSIMVEKIENMEPPIAHMIPEGSGHILLPVISFIALLTLDWRIALASLVTVPLSLVFMTLTMIISGKSFTQYDESNAHMNSTIVEYIEGIEVIKAFGRAGTSYEKYAKAILDYKKFVVKWLSSTWITMKMTFALFPSTLLGTLPVGLYLTMHGQLTISQLVLAVMLSMSMVTSFAKIEVFSENLREMQYNIESIQDFLTMKELPEPSVYANINSYDVKLENVHFSYTGEEKDEVLHGIDLTLPAGSFTALVGPSGGGKSTIAKLLAGLVQPSQGKVSLFEEDISRTRKMALALRKRCQIVFQNPFGALNPRLTVEAALREPLELMNLESHAEERIREALQSVSLPEDFLARYPHELSGGQRQRVCIARGILSHPDLLICDEIVSALDPTVQVQVLLTLHRLQQERRFAMFFISHDLDIVEHISTKIAVVYRGSIVEYGPAEAVMNSPKHPYTQQLIQANRMASTRA